MDTSSIPGLELMQIADVVAREKSIEREEVIMAMEEAIQKAGRSKYGNDRDIRAMIDRKTGSIQLGHEADHVPPGVTAPVIVTGVD